MQDKAGKTTHATVPRADEWWSAVSDDETHSHWPIGHGHPVRVLTLWHAKVRVPSGERLPNRPIRGTIQASRQCVCACAHCCRPAMTR